MSDTALGNQSLPGSTGPRLAVRPLSKAVQYTAEGVFLFVFLYAFNVFTPHLRPVDEETLTTVRAHAPLATEASPLNQVIWIGLMLLAGAMMLSAPRRIVSFLPYAMPLMALCALALISPLWALVPELSFRRAVLFTFVIAVLGFSVIYAKNPKRILLLLYIIFLIALVPNLLVIPHGGAWHDQDPFFKGIMPHKNNLGAIAVVAIFVGFAAWRSRAVLLEKLILAGYLAGWALVLVLTVSKTSLALVVLIPVALIGMRLVRQFIPLGRPSMVIAGLMVFAAIVALLTYGLGFTVSELMAMVFPDPTLTGRTHLWEFASEKIAERPLLGYGFHSFWGIGFDSPAARAPLPFARVVNQAHNGYLDLVVNLGIVGAIVFAVVFISFLSSVRQVGHYDRRLATLIWSVLLYILASNMTETSFLRQTSLQWMLFIVMIFWAHSIHQTLAYQKAGVITAPAGRRA